MNSVTLLGWFMKYMDKFMVIEPQMLRENIKTKLENKDSQIKDLGLKITDWRIHWK